MLRTKSIDAADAFASAVKQVIEECSRDVSSVSQAMQRPGNGNGRECMDVVCTMQADVQQAQAHTSGLIRLTNSVPPARRLVERGEQTTAAIEQVLDRLQQVLVESYQVKPSALSLKESDGPDIGFEKPNGRGANYDLGGVETPRLAKGNRLSGTSTPKTKSDAGAKEDKWMTLEMPKTPRLEDFGLCAAELRALETGENGVGAYEGDRDFDGAVEDSMARMGIETAEEVAERFDSRRHVALRGMMARATGGAVEADVLGMAEGYSGSVGVENEK